MEVWHLLYRPERLFYKSCIFRLLLGILVHLHHHLPGSNEGETTARFPRTMSSRFVIVIELPERSCSAQLLEHVLDQVRVFFNGLSSWLREFTGQHLRVAIGPWEAQHCRWAGASSVEAPESSQNDAFTRTTLPLEGLARHAALEVRQVQGVGVHTPAQQHGIDGRVFTEENREPDQHSTSGARFEDLKVLFPDHDFGISFDAAPSPFAGQYHHLHLNSLEGFDINGQPLPPPHQILPSNAASPSNARENDVGSPMGDETLIRRAANNLAARPVCEYTTSQENPYPRLQWETPRYPADYLTPSPNGPSKSQSPSRKRY